MALAAKRGKLTRTVNELSAVRQACEDSVRSALDAVAVMGSVDEERGIDIQEITIPISHGCIPQLCSLVLAFQTSFKQLPLARRAVEVAIDDLLGACRKPNDIDDTPLPNDVAGKIAEAEIVVTDALGIESEWKRDYDRLCAEMSGRMEQHTSSTRASSRTSLRTQSTFLDSTAPPSHCTHREQRPERSPAANVPHVGTQEYNWKREMPHRSQLSNATECEMNPGSPRLTPYQSYDQPHVSLPPIKVHPFDGKKASYDEFKIIFDLAIASQPLRNVQKFLYLRTLVPKVDQTAMSRLPITDNGYELAWEYLNEKYSNVTSMVHELWEQLSTLELTDKSADSHKQIWFEAQSIASQLERVYALEERTFMREILAKFSSNLREKVLDNLSKTTSSSWQNFKATVTRTINAQEQRDLLSRAFNPKSYSDGNHAIKDRSVAHSESPASNKYRKHKSCSYCRSQDHASFECPNVAESQRREYLTNQGCCLNCTGRNHETAQCKHKQTCQRCQKAHHRSLPCLINPSNTSQKQEHSWQKHENINRNHQRPSWQSHGPTDTRFQPRGNSSSPNRLEEKPHSVNLIEMDRADAVITWDTDITNKAHINTVTQKEEQSSSSVESSLHHTLPVLNCGVEGTTDRTWILLDCGAQLSLIDASLARQWKLPVVRKTTLRLQGFRSKKVTTMQSHVVKISLIGSTGERVSLLAHTIDNPMDIVEMTAITERDKQFLRKNGLELPQHRPSLAVKPRLIIGVDALWSVFTGLKIANMPSGKRHVTTSLGPLVTGPQRRSSTVGKFHLVVAPTTEPDRVPPDISSRNTTRPKATVEWTSHVSKRALAHAVSYKASRIVPNLEHNLGVSKDAVAGQDKSLEHSPNATFGKKPRRHKRRHRPNNHRTGQMSTRSGSASDIGLVSIEPTATVTEKCPVSTRIVRQPTDRKSEINDAPKRLQVAEKSLGRPEGVTDARTFTPSKAISGHLFAPRLQREAKSASTERQSRFRAYSHFRRLAPK